MTSRIKKKKLKQIWGKIAEESKEASNYIDNIEIVLRKIDSLEKLNKQLKKINPTSRIK